MSEMIVDWIVVTPDGVITTRDDEPTLAALQQAVGGDIEAVPSPMPNTSVMICEVHEDREGNPLPINPKATAFLHTVLWPGQRIVGPMVVAGAPDDEGELTPLTDEQLATLREKLK